MNEPYEPTERLARRAAKIWRILIESVIEHFGTDPTKTVPTDEQLGVFEQDLSARLMCRVKDASGEEFDYPEYVSIGANGVMSYILIHAFGKAGIHTNCGYIPANCRMALSNGHIDISAFGGEHVHYYTLTDTLWMVSALSGSESGIEELKKIVLAGRLPEIRVEDDDFNEVTINAQAPQTADSQDAA